MSVSKKEKEPDLLNLLVRVEGRDIPINLGQELEISLDLNTEMERQPGRFAFIAAMYEVARVHGKILQLRLDRLGHALDLQARADWPRDDMGKESPKLTEAGVKAKVELDETYSKLRDELLDAEKVEYLLRVGRDAMNHKREMLISIGANMRSEFAQEVRILKEKAKDQLRSPSSEDH